MAKTRVYELARDLNLTNKILLSKLSDLDISVKSHMSALDDDTVASLKQQLFGKKEEAVEETRIRPTVIRRRKKKVTAEAASEPTSKPEELDAAEQPAEEVPGETELVEESAAAEDAPQAAEDQTAEEETAQAQPADAAVAEAKVEQPEELTGKKPKKVVKKVKKQESAKIIQLPLKPVEKPTTDKPAKKGKPKIKSLPAGKAAGPKPGAEPEEASAKDAKKKKWKKKGEEGDHDRKF